MTLTRTRPDAPAARPVDPRRLLRLARLDMTLLWRNRTALFGVVGLPAFFAVMLLVSDGNGHQSAGVPAVLYTGTGDLAFFLLPAVFMNLVSVFTARREELTLKRLRSGPLSDAEALGGSVLGATALYLAQSAVIVVIIATALDGGLPADPVLMLLGMLLGAVVFALLAMALSGVTPTVEMAQLTVIPVLLVSMLGSGFMFPLEEAPVGVRAVAQVMPLTPAVEIARTAYLGRDFTVDGDHGALGLVETWTACVPALLTLAAWIVVGAWLARRYFRWEPRRG
ncbi:ABC-2 type transport system permease protein [Thermomonospora echinospora]|uniref:Transport permease protein n=1 Tax=Thermomonospora echinospora TaxID=1992 RepID=A0A1H5SJ50_9ACTN|nr:ABC transporter permease [Thermomonospora echinospora]SEF50460.1 ABC-2 type transport system permease protein [Thermomonospora echinospora]